jgi:hypothetical protein
MNGLNAEFLVTETKELYPGAEHPRLISDTGSRFIAKDFQELPALLEVDHALPRQTTRRATGNWNALTGLSRLNT